MLGSPFGGNYHRMLKDYNTARSDSNFLGRFLYTVEACDLCLCKDDELQKEPRV